MVARRAVATKQVLSTSGEEMHPHRPFERLTSLGFIFDLCPKPFDPLIGSLLPFDFPFILLLSAATCCDRLFPPWEMLPPLKVDSTVILDMTASGFCVGGGFRDDLRLFRLLSVSFRSNSSSVGELRGISSRLDRRPLIMRLQWILPLLRTIDWPKLCPLIAFTNGRSRIVAKVRFGNCIFHFATVSMVFPDLCLHERPPTRREKRRLCMTSNKWISGPVECQWTQ